MSEHPARYVKNQQVIFIVVPNMILSLPLLLNSNSIKICSRMSRRCQEHVTVSRMTEDQLLSNDICTFFLMP